MSDWEKRGEDENTKTWISRKQKDQIKSILHYYLIVIMGTSKTANSLKPSKTTCNHPKPTTISINHPQQPKNYPKPLKTT